MNRSTLKPLYLDGAVAAPVSVQLDGPALKVLKPGRCAGRYPLRLLSRVMVSGAVEWAMPALLACLRNGIVVSFLDKNGEFVGMCIGASPGKAELSDRLQEFALRPDWPHHYARWYTAMERRGILRLVKSFGLRSEDLRPATVRRSIVQHMARIAPAQIIRNTLNHLESAVSACAARTALDRGISSTLLVDEGAGYQLIRDLGRLLAWETPAMAAQLLIKEGNQGLPCKKDLANAVEAEHDQLF